ncbi:MAG: redoxin domain-containing protein [Acidimicrobiia bacterium]|nr:redoxin domain-containing protein [Acidimicrobiia bacterium]
MNATKARAQRRHAGRNKGLPLFPLAIGLVVLLGIVAIIVTVAGSDDSAADETRPVTVDGEPLPQMPDGADPAIGMTAPAIRGENFAGEPVKIEADGRAKAIAFVAHWCPHCQAEVPKLADYLDGPGLPEGVDLYFVSTSVDSGQGELPAVGLARAQGVGDVPTVVDDAKTKAYISYGAGGFPFMVFLDADNKVVLRTTGELPDGSYEQYFGALAAGTPLAPAPAG